MSDSSKSYGKSEERENRNSFNEPSRHKQGQTKRSSSQIKKLTLDIEDIKEPKHKGRSKDSLSVLNNTEAPLVIIQKGKQSTPKYVNVSLIKKPFSSGRSGGNSSKRKKGKRPLSNKKVFKEYKPPSTSTRDKGSQLRMSFFSAKDGSNKSRLSPN